MFIRFTVRETMFPNFGIMNNVSRRIAAQSVSTNNNIPNVMNYNSDGSFDKLLSNESSSSLSQQQRFNNMAEDLLYNSLNNRSGFERHNPVIYQNDATVLEPIQPYRYPNTSIKQDTDIKSLQLEALATTPPKKAEISQPYPTNLNSVNQYSEVQLPLYNPTAQNAQNMPNTIGTTNQSMFNRIGSVIGLNSTPYVESFSLPQYMQTTNPVIQTRIIVICTIVFVFAIFMCIQLYLSHKKIQLLLSLYKANIRNGDDLDFVIKDIF